MRDSLWFLKNKIRLKISKECFTDIGFDELRTFQRFIGQSLGTKIVFSRGLKCGVPFSIKENFRHEKEII